VRCVSRSRSCPSHEATACVVRREEKTAPETTHQGCICRRERVPGAVVRDVCEHLHAGWPTHVQGEVPLFSQQCVQRGKAAERSNTPGPAASLNRANKCLWRPSLTYTFTACTRSPLLEASSLLLLDMLRRCCTHAEVARLKWQQGEIAVCVLARRCRHVRMARLVVTHTLVGVEGSHTLSTSGHATCDSGASHQWRVDGRYRNIHWHGDGALVWHLGPSVALRWAPSRRRLCPGTTHALRTWLRSSADAAPAVLWGTTRGRVRAQWTQQWMRPCYIVPAVCPV
jgi:hypothetical protein